MVAYISSWARQVIVSVVIAIILEMILSPDSKSTKYIKTVIGIYVVYAIIAPGLNLIGGKNLNFSSIDYENYFTKSDIYQNLEINVEKIENENFEETYKLNLRQDIENKLEQKGYAVINMNLKVNLKENNEEYGTIEEIEINLSKKINNVEEDTENNEISVNKIKVGNTNTTKHEGNITDEEESEIKDFINQEYGIDRNKIFIK